MLYRTSLVCVCADVSRVIGAYPSLTVRVQVFDMIGVLFERFSHMVFNHPSPLVFVSHPVPPCVFNRRLSARSV